MSSANLIELRACPEVTPGTTPADSSNWFDIPHVSDSLAAGPETIQSKRVRTDRLDSDYLKVAETAGGAIVSELSYETAFDNLLEAVFWDTWATNVLNVGSDVKTFSIERDHTDLTKHVQIAGAYAAGARLGFVAKQAVTCEFQFAGLQGYETGTSLVGAGSSTAIAGNPVLKTNIDMASCTYGGTSIATLGINIREIHLEINNNLRPELSILSAVAAAQNPGTASVGGRFVAYVSAGAWPIYTAMLANSATSLVWSITDSGGLGYTFNMANIKVFGQPPSNPGLDQDSMIEVQFACVESTPVVTRIPS